MEIKKVTMNNVEGVEQFFRRNNFEYFSPHKDISNLTKEIYNAKLDLYYVIEHNSKIIGYGILRGMDEGYTFPSLGIGIDRGFQGIGLGSLLMQFLESECRLRGYYKIRLRVYKANVVARNLYEKLGYIFKECDEETLEGVKEI